MARTFNGSDQYLEKATATLSGQWPLTVACWFRTTAAITGGLISLGDIYGFHGHYTWLASGGAGSYIIFRTVDSTVIGTAASSSGIQSGVWHHACGVLGGSNWRSVYLDGPDDSDLDVTDVPVVPNDYFTVGVRHSGGTVPTLNYYFPGDIAEVSYWNVSLSAPEVAILAAGYPAPFVRPQNLKCYYPMIRGSKDIFGDTNYSPTEYNSPGVTDHPPMLYGAPPQYGQVITAVPSGTIFASSVLNSAIFSGTIVR